MLRCERKETMFADEYRLVRFLFYRLAEMSDLTQFSVLFYGVNKFFFFCVNESYCRLRLRCSYVTIFRFCFVKSNQLSVTNLQQQQQQQDMTDDRSFDRSTDNITFA